MSEILQNAESLSPPSLPHKTKFIHLRVHSAYSLLEGALPIETLLGYCLKFDMPAIAITDRNNLFCALEFAETLSAKGIQPITAVTLSLLDEIGGKTRPSSISLFVQNQQGYHNLITLVSKAHLRIADEQTIQETGVYLHEIAEHQEGLIFLSGGDEGPINHLLELDKKEEAENFLLNINNMLNGKIYVELQRHSESGQSHIEPLLIALADKYAIPLVATNQCFFESKDDYESHDALICIAEGTYIHEDDRRRLTVNHHLKSPEEMVSLFSDIPEALANTLEIARRCAFRPRQHEPMLPTFQTEKSEIEELEYQSQRGLEHRLEHRELEGSIEDYEERLKYEISVITEMGFAGYFLIVADFIKWAKKQNIAVGPGRGSGAGSLVAWVLTITDIDPIKFDLLFERFLNPERVSIPDFDIDFCQTRRDEVIQYVQKKYGYDRVAQIITFGKLQARAVLRDVGRVTQMPYSQVDKLCKRIPNNPAYPVTLQEAIDADKTLQTERNEHPSVAHLIDISLKLEGLYRHASTHAAGVVISDRPLQTLVALYRDPKSDMPVTQFNMKWVEKSGLVKFDFLGLKTLSILQYAVELLKKYDVEIVLSDLALDDIKTYEMLGKGDTVGVFQLESTGMRDVLQKLEPDCFEDIIALVALYRPGPMDNIPKYIACKKGISPPDYIDDMLKPVLETTYGVPIYQEQVMKIAQIMSGYSLAEADLLRRAIGKKIKKEMKDQEKRFIEGARKNGVSKQKAHDIFTQVNRFAGYGFNKSHATAYALIAYQTAYIKAHHHVALLAASMSFDCERTDKLSIFVQDAVAHKIRILPPNINKSNVLFEISDHAIIYALSAIRNVGRQVMEDIVAEREKNGLYKNIIDFVHRTIDIGLNNRILENLIMAGALDILEPNRAYLVENIKHLLSDASLVQSDKENQQNNLFLDISQGDTLILSKKEPWSSIEQLTHEFNAIGFYLSAHPLDHYITFFKQYNISHYDEVVQSTENNLLIAGVISKFEERKSQRGQSFAFITLSEPNRFIEVVVFSEMLDSMHELLQIGNLVIVSVKIIRENNQRRLQAENIRPIEQVIASLQIFIENEESIDHLKIQLNEAHNDPNIYKRSINLILQNANNEIHIKLPIKYAINQKTYDNIKNILGVTKLIDI